MSSSVAQPRARWPFVLLLGLVAVVGGARLASRWTTPTPAPLGIRLVDLLPDAIEVPPAPAAKIDFHLDALPPLPGAHLAGVPFVVETDRPFVVRVQLGGRENGKAIGELRGLTAEEAAAFGPAPRAIEDQLPGQPMGPCIRQKPADDGWAECERFDVLTGPIVAGLLVVYEPALGARDLTVYESAYPDPRAPASPDLGPLVRRWNGRSETGLSGRTGLAAPPTGRYVFELALPANAELRVATGHEGGVLEAPMRFVIHQDDRLLLDEVHVPDGRFHDHRLALTGRGGQKTRLTLEARPVSGRDGPTRGLWLDPHVLGASSAPNILFVTIDALRTDHLSTYGYPRDTAPVLTTLAQAGARFDRSTAQATRTWESVLSLLSGRYPAHTGVRRRGVPLPPDVPLLPDLLSAAGYETFAGARLADFPQSMMEGFDETDVVDTTARGVQWSRQEPQLYAAQLRNLMKSSTGRPFLAWYHVASPHYPLHPTQPLRFHPGYQGRFASELNDADHKDAHWSALSPSERDQIVALYDASVRDADDILGALIAELTTAGVLENTVIVVSADHGEIIGRGEFTVDHPYLPFDPVLHVPLVMAWPGHIERQVTIPARVQSIDIVPTLLSLAGVPPAAGLDGRDLSPGLHGQPLPDRPAYAEVVEKVFARYDRDEELIDNRQHFDALAARAVDRPVTMAERELYDVSTDPEELHNLAATDPDRVDRSMAALDRELAAWRAPVSSGSTDLGQDALEALTAAGYVQNLKAAAAAANTPR